MEVAMPLISNVKNVRSKRLQKRKDFRPQSLATHAKKREQFIPRMAYFKKVFDSMGDHIVELSSEN